MSLTKPLDVVMLRRNRHPHEEEYWESYLEYGLKGGTPTKDWSGYILANEGEVDVIGVFPCSCTYSRSNTGIHLLRPGGEEGDTVMCHGMGSHTMMFHLASDGVLTLLISRLHLWRLAQERATLRSLICVGNESFRPLSETGRINVMVHHPRRLTSGGEVIGKPSPDAEETNKSGWEQYASLDFS